MPYCYYLKSRSTTPCNVPMDAWDIAAKSWLCPVCHNVLPNASVTDLSIDTQRPKTYPLEFIYNIQTALVHVELAVALQLDRHDDIKLWPVLGPQGKVLDLWKAATSDAAVRILGTADINQRRCQGCGRYNYFALGKKYVLDDGTIDDRTALTESCGFVVGKSAYTLIADSLDPFMKYFTKVPTISNTA